MSVIMSQEFGEKAWPIFTAPPIREYESFVITRAQSILTMDGQIGPLLSFEQAQDVIKWQETSPRKYL